MKDSWKKIFAIIWTGQIFSILTSNTIGYAVTFWLSIETGSPTVLAMSYIAALLPQAVLGIFSGVIVDRFNKKAIMIIADVFIATCTLGLSLIFFVGIAELWYIYVLLALRSAGSAFHGPAWQAAIPLLAPQDKLTRIAAVNQTIISISTIAGPILGALFISIMDMSYILLIDVAGAIIACTMLSFVKIPKVKTEIDSQQLHVFKDIKDGFKEILQHTGLIWIIVFSMLSNFFIMPIGALFPLVSLQHFMGNEFHMSVVEMAWGGGMLIGGAIIGIINNRFNKINIINCMYFISGLSFAISGLLPQSGFIWFVILAVCSGISWSLYLPSVTVVLQTVIKPEVLGRVFAFTMNVSMLPSLLGLVGTGFIAEKIGILNIFIIGGMSIVMIGIISMIMPSIKVLRTRMIDK
ncbi:MFS transporter [Bacteroidales bacterium OttesenSCG-928-K22]|nr:MFS transporter [Bacteroidales bacterium OttesenSCG-928-L14]MDL2240600.1 MFS transporter [Bacteroidales bacterium OttesenSCG-928-K22]